MSCEIDEKYLLLLAPQLINFKKQYDGVYNFKCPICGDSQRDKTKTRGYCYIKNSKLLVYCHNCSYSSKFGYFLKNINLGLYNDYIFEKFSKNNETFKKIETQQKKTEVNYEKLELINLYDADNKFTEYAIKRGFKEPQLKRVYYCPKFREWSIHHFGKKYEKLIEEERIIFPIFDNIGNLIAANGRTIDPNNKKRYISVVHPDAPHVIFGLEKWDRTRDTYITEGAIDSLFIDNCLGAGSSALSKVSNYLSLHNSRFIHIWDNQPRNKEIVGLIKKGIDAGLSVFIWPDLPYKDVNETILAGVDFNNLLKDNTYTGLLAEIKFLEWKKI